MLIIIDNYDSFTYNLYQQVENLGQKTQIFLHDRITIPQLRKLKPRKIIISPGPKDPKEAGISMEVIKKFHQKIPILGVCLGHQCIGELFGAKIISAKEVLHGKTSFIHHSGKNLFHGIKNPFQAARYHSLAVSKLPENFQLDAWTPDREIMGISHQKYPLFGIQFHPESFMTKEGDKIIQNFLNS